MAGISQLPCSWDEKSTVTYPAEKTCTCLVNVPGINVIWNCNYVTFCKRPCGPFCVQVSRYLKIALEEGQYWEFPWWGYMKHHMLEKQFVVPWVTRRARMGEKSLERSLVLKHCCSGLCPWRFPRHILPVKTCFIYFVNLVLHPSFL